MKINAILQGLDASNICLKETETMATGFIDIDGTTLAVFGTQNEASLSHEMTLAFTDFILEIIETKPGIPILSLVDTGGQETSLEAELLGLNYSYGHMVQCLSFAKLQGHRLLTLVYGKALGGAFIALGLQANEVVGLSTAQLAVMWLEAMSKVTNVPLETLQELAKTSAIFAPGVENFWKLGCIDNIIKPDILAHEFRELLSKSGKHKNQWSEQGNERKGRYMTQKVQQLMHNA